MTERGGTVDGNDAQWRRPAFADSTDGGGLSGGVPLHAPDQPAYTGPPASTRPPAGWRPPMIAQPPPPRAMPAQNHEYLDAAEQSARTLTYGIGMVAGAILLVVFCALCAGALF